MQPLSGSCLLQSKWLLLNTYSGTKLFVKIQKTILQKLLYKKAIGQFWVKLRKLSSPLYSVADIIKTIRQPRWRGGRVPRRGTNVY